MITKIQDVPTGVLVTVYTAILRCRGCGTVVCNAEYEARATDRYADTGDGKVRREFIFEGGNPFCECDDCIWLSSDDLPYVAGDWPVSAKQNVPIERLGEGHEKKSR